MERHKEQRYRRHQNAHADAARHAAADVAGNHDMGRHRRHQQLFYVALKLGAEER